MPGLYDPLLSGYIIYDRHRDLQSFMPEVPFPDEENSMIYLLHLIIVKPVEGPHLLTDQPINCFIVNGMPNCISWKN